MPIEVDFTQASEETVAAAVAAGVLDEGEQFATFRRKGGVLSRSKTIRMDGSHLNDGTIGDQIKQLHAWVEREGFLGGVDEVFVSSKDEVDIAGDFTEVTRVFFISGWVSASEEQFAELKRFAGRVKSEQDDAVIAEVENLRVAAEEFRARADALEESYRQVTVR